MLTGWLDDDRVEWERCGQSQPKAARRAGVARQIDNNLCENAIRPTAVGKKNWLLIGAEEAGWRSAVIYSVITSCRNRGTDPFAYLRDVLTRLPSMTNRQIPEITSAAWSASRATSFRIAS